MGHLGSFPSTMKKKELFKKSGSVKVSRISVEVSGFVRFLAIMHS